MTCLSFSGSGWKNIESNLSENYQKRLKFIKVYLFKCFSCSQESARCCKKVRIPKF